MGSKINRPSPNLEMALTELEELVDLGVKFVPVQPSLAMIQAGARAGGIDEALAAKIYPRRCRRTDGTSSPRWSPRDRSSRNRLRTDRRHGPRQR